MELASWEELRQGVRCWNEQLVRAKRGYKSTARVIEQFGGLGSNYWFLAR